LRLHEEQGHGHDVPGRRPQLSFARCDLSRARPKVGIRVSRPFTVIGPAIAGVIDSAPFGSIVPDVSLPGRVFLIAIFMPGCPRRYSACMTRERSGWCWIIPIPLIGVPVLLFWPVQPGETGPNACGPDPTMRPGDGHGQSALRVQRP